MKSLTLNYANCLYEKDFLNGLKQKTLLSTKMEKMCKKHIVNKVNKNSKITDFPFMEKQEIKDIQLFGTKISRLYSNFILVGENSIISGIKAINSFYYEDKKSNINLEIISSENVQKLENIFEKEDLSKTFFYFVLPDENEISTLSLLSLTIAKLKEVLKDEFFVNVNVCTKKGNKLYVYCEENKIKTITFPSDINEKNSTLSPAMLFPMAVLNIDLEKVLTGAKQVLENFKQEDASKSLSFATALINFNFYQLKRRKISLLSRDVRLQNFVQHFENLLEDFNFSYDEKVVMILKNEKLNDNLKLPKFKGDISIPKSLQDVDNCIFNATKQTLKEKGIPNYTLEVFEKTDETLGQLIFFFELTALIMQELFNSNFDEDFENKKREKIKDRLKEGKLKEEDNPNFEIKI